jgi:hypothetical protein
MNDETDVSSVLTACTLARHRFENVGKEKAKENSRRFFSAFFISSTQWVEQGESCLFSSSSSAFTWRAILIQYSQTAE